MKRIIQIVPFFGMTPAWLNFFIKSCHNNPEITWLIYGDIKFPDFVTENIIFKKAELSDFNKLISEKLSLKITILNPYKICDYRPAFGKIFEDYISEYDYWGYSDLDLIFGKISNFIPIESLIKYDIIASRDDYYPGHFMLFRNCESLKNMYKRIFNYSSIFKDVYRHYAIDERSNLIGKAIGVSESATIFRRIKYKILKSLPLYHDLNLLLDKSSITKKLKILRLNQKIRSDHFYIKRGVENWSVIWDNGVLIDQITNKEIMYFHFLKSKSNFDFHIDVISNHCKFKVDENGIHCLQ